MTSSPYLAQAGIVLATKVARSDCDELGLEEIVDRESLSHLRIKDVFIRKGGDCSGETVSFRSSDSRSSEGPVMGENNGKGTATDDSVWFEETLSDEDTLPIVCLLRGITDLPFPG